LSSEASNLVIINNDEVNDIATSSPIITDPSTLPSKPVIIIALYAYKTLYLKWSLSSNGGSEISQINLSILKYGISGAQNTLSLSILN